MIDTSLEKYKDELHRDVLVKEHFQKSMRVNMAKAVAKGKRFDEWYIAACHVYLGGKKLTALLDTGASISLISQKCVEDLKLEIKPSDVEKAEALSGHEVELSGLTETDVKLGSKLLHQQPLYAVENLGEFDLILGCDTLRKLGNVLFDFDKGRVKFFNSSSASMTGKSIPIGPAAHPVQIAKDITLAPRSETVFMANIPSASPNVDYEVDPIQGFIEKTGTHPAKALVRPRKGQVPVRILNPQAEAVKLFKGTTMGSATFIGPLELSATVKTLTHKKDSTPANADPLQDISLKGSILSSEEQNQLMKLLTEFKDVFSQNGTEIGCIPGVEHKIETQGHPPIRQRPFRTEFSRRQEVRNQVGNLLEAGVVRPSCSPWASPIVLVGKKDGTQRMCVDYRKLNAITRKDTFPLPLISEILDSLDGAKYFSSFDVTSGYHHVKVAPEDIEKTAFTTFEGTYEYLRLPFGLTSGPGTYQRAMQKVMNGLSPPHCIDLPG